MSVGPLVRWSVGPLRQNMAHWAGSCVRRLPYVRIVYEQVLKIYETYLYIIIIAKLSSSNAATWNE